MLPNPCDLPGADLLPACKVAGGIEKAAAAVDAATDPFGYMAVQLQKGALGLSETVLPALEELTHPDLTVDWFIGAYRVSFALAIFVWVAFLAWNFVQLARRRISGDDLIETLAFYTPMFLGGSIFGPLLGTLVVSLIGALSDSVLAWGVNGTIGTITEALNTAIEGGDPNEIVGGAAIALILFLALLLALLLVFVMLLVLLVTQYLTGIIIPLSLVWLNHPTQRSKGMKVVMVWIGICVSHILLFLLLGAAFQMVGSLTTGVGDPALKVLSDLTVAVIALLVATLSPVALLKFAPVGASSAPSNGPSLRRSGERTGGGSQYPPAPGSDSQMGQMGRDESGSGGGSGTGDAGSDTSGSGSSSSPGLSGKLEEAKAAKDSSSSSMEPSGAGSDAGGDGGSIGAGVGSGGPGGGAKPASLSGGPSTSDPLSAAGHDASDSAASGQPSGADATSGMASAGTKTSESGQKISQAGAAAEATGVGAPAGLAMQTAGGLMQAAGSATAMTAEMAQSAGDLAGEQMEHGEDDTGPGA